MSYLESVTTFAFKVQSYDLVSESAQGRNWPWKWPWPRPWPKVSSSSLFWRSCRVLSRYIIIFQIWRQLTSSWRQRSFLSQNFSSFAHVRTFISIVDFEIWCVVGIYTECSCQFSVQLHDPLWRSRRFKSTKWVLHVFCSNFENFNLLLS